MKIYNKILALLLLPLIIFTTGGVNIFHHHCNMTGYSDFSVIIEQTSCKHHSNAHHNDSSCGLSGHCCNVKPLVRENDIKGTCCVTTTEFYRTDVSYIPGDDTDFSIYSSFDRIDFNPVPAIHEKKDTAACGYFFNDISPPLSGKKMLISFHQLRFSDPPSMA